MPPVDADVKAPEGEVKSTEKAPGDALAEAIRAQTEALKGVLDRAPAVAPAAPAKAKKGMPAVTPEEIQRAQEDPAELIRLVERQVAARMELMIEELDEKRLRPLEEQGKRGFAELARRTAGAGDAYYKANKKEIDEILGRDFAGYEHDPRAIDEAVLRHKGLNYEKAIERERTSLIEKIKAGETEAFGFAVRMGNADTGEPRVPSAKALEKAGKLSKEAVALIKRAGGEEAFAKKATHGKRNWPEFLAHQGLWKPEA